ncbi:MAG: hypothetical protein IPK64_15595 [bacterium]|nr:hypothetical protein [bacterium]
MNARRLDPAPPIDWSIDSADGPVQGPLALAFLQGRELALHLLRGQSALLLGEGRLRAVFGPGRHELHVGGAAGGVDARWHLLFLCLGDGLDLRWSAAAPLRCGPSGDVALVGGGRLVVADVGAFHDAFLAGAEIVDPALVLTLADRLLQAAVAARLATPTIDGPGDWSAAGVDTRLAALRAEDLAEDLAPCGLACHSLDIQAVCGDIERDGARAAPVLSPQQG